MKRIDRSSKVRKNFHQAKWDEPIIFELSNTGERGIQVPLAEDEIQDIVGKGIDGLPEQMVPNPGSYAIICGYRSKPLGQM